MGRGALPDGYALWLPGENGIHMFFMRIPIDVVFLGRPDSDGGRRVVAAREALRPWTGIVPFVRSAYGVLELPVGVIQSSGTQAGDLVRLNGGSAP